MLPEPQPGPCMVRSLHWSVQATGQSHDRAATARIKPPGWRTSLREQGLIRGDAHIVAIADVATSAGLDEPCTSSKAPARESASRKNDMLISAMSYLRTLMTLIGRTLMSRVVRVSADEGAMRDLR